MKKKNSVLNRFFNNKIAVAVTAVIILIALFFGVFFLTTFIYDISNDNEPVSDESDVITTLKNESESEKTSTIAIGGMMIKEHPYRFHPRFTRKTEP
jgi:hypothetical protein